MKKTHPWMLFFLFLFFVSEILACTKKEEKLVFYQTTQIQKMDDSKEDTQFFQEEAQTSQVSESSLHETTQAAVETIAVYLCGEVCKPGVYVLQAGSRLYQAVEEAGAFLLVLECVPAKLAKLVTESINIPTIGIGAGAGCDGQVLVYQDMLGLSNGHTPKFVKKFADAGGLMRQGIKEYINETKSGEFPSEEYTYKIDSTIIAEIKNEEEQE